MNEAAPKPESDGPTQEDVEAGVCPECQGTAGHHFLTCPSLQRDGAIETDKEPEDEGEGGVLTLEDDAREAADEEPDNKLPPSAAELEGNDMVWLIAKLCHEANRQFCAEICGDFSHKPWEDTPEDLRASIREGVLHVFDNPEVTPAQSHQAWMDYKKAHGWTYGNVKDHEAKTHPNLVPFDQLHIHERFKDVLFTTICKTMFGE